MCYKFRNYDRNNLRYNFGYQKFQWILNMCQISNFYYNILVIYDPDKKILINLKRFKHWVNPLQGNDVKLL